MIDRNLGALHVEKKTPGWRGEERERGGDSNPKKKLISEKFRAPKIAADALKSNKKIEK